MIRPATRDDAAAAGAVLRAAYPDRLATEAGIAHGTRTAPPSARQRHVAAIVDGELVGWAHGSLDWGSTTPTDAFAALVVHPAHRRKGLGRSLWAELDAHLTEIGAGVVRMFGDADCAAFARSRRFELTSTTTVLQADTGAAREAWSPPAGIEIRSLRDCADRVDELFAVDHATMLDEPGDHDFGGVTQEDWVTETLDHPDHDAELSTVALDDGRIVGMSHLFADRTSGRAYNGGTGVLAGHRGRGIGHALKRVGLGRAAAAGIRSVCTTNDDTNAAMLAINRRLGYVPFATRTAWRRDPA